MMSNAAANSDSDSQPHTAMRSNRRADFIEIGTASGRGKPAETMEPAASIPIHAADESTKDAESAEIVANLQRVAHRLRIVLTAHFAEFGLSDVRFAALQIIRQSAPAGCSQSELAEQLQQSESSISALVDRMRGSRLLYRLRFKFDRRKRVLMLTDRGRQMLERVQRCHDRRMTELLKCFDFRQKELFAELLQQLGTELSRKHAGFAIGDDFSKMDEENHGRANAM